MSEDEETENDRRSRPQGEQEEQAKPGGAEGGEDSPSKDRNVLPADDDAPLGDTDQHSSSTR